MSGPRRGAAHDSCLACQCGSGHDGDITRCSAPLVTEHGSMHSPSADSTRGVPAFGKCQTWPCQPVVVGGAGSRDPCPYARDAERPCHRSWSTQHAKSSAADRNKVLRLRRSGDVVLQHDLLECVEPKRLSSLNENVAWIILLAHALTQKGGIQIRIIRTKIMCGNRVAAHRAKSSCYCPASELRVGGAALLANPEIARHARPVPSLRF